MAKKPRKQPKVRINEQAVAGSNLRIYITDAGADDLPVYRYHIELLRNKSEQVYAITVDDPESNGQLIRAFAHELAKDPTIIWGKDQRPYRWTGSHWKNCWNEVKGWATKLSDAIGGVLGDDVGRGGSVLQALYMSWQADALADLDEDEAAEYRMLTPFGIGPGIPFEDSQLVRDGASWTVTPAKPEYRNRHCLPMTTAAALEALEAWKSGEANPVYDEDGRPTAGLLRHFISTSFSPDQAEVYQQWAALHCIQHVSDEADDNERFLVMQGSGGNGKRPAVELIGGLVTKAGTVSLKMQDLGPQTVEKLAGKIAMIGTENTKNVDLEMLKSVVSKERQMANPKYRDPYELDIMCLVTQSCNETPYFGEKSDAIAERLILLKMEGKFRRGNTAKVFKLADKIIEHEYHWLIAWMLEGAERMLDNGGVLTIPDSVARDGLEAARGGNQIEALVPALQFGKFAISVPELTAWYKGWCDAEGHRPLNLGNLVAELARVAMRENLPVLPQKLGRRDDYSRYQGANGNVHVRNSPMGLPLPSRPELIYGVRIAAGSICDEPVGIAWDGPSRRGETLKAKSAIKEQAELPVTTETIDAEDTDLDF